MMNLTLTRTEFGNLICSFQRKAMGTPKKQPSNPCLSKYGEVER